MLLYLLFFLNHIKLFFKLLPDRAGDPANQIFLNRGQTGPASANINKI